MINIFKHYHGIPKFHKNNKKYGDYILAMRNKPLRMENTNLVIIQAISPRYKLLNSIYGIGDLIHTPQGHTFWEKYIDDIDIMNYYEIAKFFR